MTKANAIAMNDMELDMVAAGGFMDIFSDEPTHPVDKAIKKVKEAGMIALGIAGTIVFFAKAAQAVKDIANKGYC